MKLITLRTIATIKILKGKKLKFKEVSVSKRKCDSKLDKLYKIEPKNKLLFFKL